MKSARVMLVLGVLAVLLGGLAWLSRSRESHVGHEHGASGKSITDTGIEWPSREKIWRTISLADYNTRVVFAGVTALGAASGLVGTFLLLRKRSLLSDTVSHCTLPGIAIAFLIAEATGVSGRSLPLLLLGAAVTGVLGMAAVATIRARSRVKDDAALAIVLSVFFGLGIALMVIIQQLPTGNAAGLSHFIYGKAASMTAGDARLILYASLLVAVVCAALFKEFKLLCFDVNFARTQGWPTIALDLALMGLVVAVTVIGLQAVGLLLVVAMLIIPAAAARFWSHRLGVTVLLATLIGAASGLVGVAASALFPKLPAGAVIVLAAVFCFAVSFVFGAERGLCKRWLEHRHVSQRVARQHLLRAIYEWCEARLLAAARDPMNLLDCAVPLAELRRSNDWNEARLRHLLRLGFAERLVTWNHTQDAVHLTAEGKIEARRVTRNHRLWETYLLHYADVAPQHIHHNADQIEHVVEPNLVNELEELLAGREGAALVPADPEKPGVIVNGGVEI
jgi:manganese/zinc/iron transport system permease protein